MDSVFVAKSEVLEALNLLRENNLETSVAQEILNKLKEEFANNKLAIESETFDIFGNVEDDTRKLK